MPTPIDCPAAGAVPEFDPAAYARLIGAFHATASAQTAKRWLLLEAAHVLGQTHLVAHLETHWLMLGQAARERDAREIAGQVMRLAFVPLGHLSGRLPLGNSGRADVSAFEPMPVRPDIAAAIDAARRGAAIAT
jgi:Protein of unknown function (DUF3703)